MLLWTSWFSASPAGSALLVGSEQEGKHFVEEAVAAGG